MTRVERPSAHPPPLAVQGPGHQHEVALLQVLLLAVLLLPQYYTLIGFGSVGQPSLMLSLLLAVVWAACKLLGSMPMDRTIRAGRAWLVAYALFTIFSLGTTFARSITPLEASGAVRSVIYVIGLVGIGLYTADGISSRRSLHRLLGTIVLLAYASAAVAITQFATGSDPLAFLNSVPLFHTDLEARTLDMRAGFTRPHGSVGHAIEFGVLSGALLPLAVHLFRQSSARCHRILFAACCGLLAVGVPLSLSRSGILAAAASLGVMALGWSWRSRLTLLASLMGATFTAWLAAPRVFGALVLMFAGWETDSSVQARVERVPMILNLWRERPLLGLGTGTFSVEDYFLVDNQIYSSLLEQGSIGAGILMCLFASALLSLWRLRRSAPDALLQGAALAVAASLVGILISMLTFDAFYFRAVTSLLFLLTGLAVALQRLAVDDARSATPSRAPRAVHQLLSSTRFGG
jgi:O-antigen ligase